MTPNYRSTLVLVIAVTSVAGAQQSTSATGSPRRGPVSQATQVAPGEQCPSGQTEVRPHRCMAPEFAPPSIVDYRPRSTLVVAGHMVRTAKFPAIDYHGHPNQLVASAEGLASLGASLDSINVRMMVDADNLSGDRLRTAIAAIRASPMRDRVRVLAGINFRDVGPGWAQKAVAQLEADVAAGAVGGGEIGKGMGLFNTKADGSRLRIDDPDLDPVWDACAQLGIPVFIHTADPEEFFQPIDNKNERWLELSLFADRRYPSDRFPSFEELMTERDNL